LILIGRALAVPLPSETTMETDPSAVDADGGWFRAAARTEDISSITTATSTTTTISRIAVPTNTGYEVDGGWFRAAFRET
jgi:hypothetical protein